MFKGSKIKKHKVGNHVMYLDPKDTGISTSLMKLKKGTDREPAFMKILEDKYF